MTEQDFNVMEKDILSSESIPKEEKGGQVPKYKAPKIKTPNFSNAGSKIKAFLLFFKSPKRIIVIMTILITVLSSLAFIFLLLGKQAPLPTEKPTPKLASPSPKIDNETLNYKKEVEAYTNMLDGLQKDVDDLAFPRVNLKDVKF